MRNHKIYGPDLIGIGMAKSGTTWTHRHLAKQPNIYMGEHKEFHYLSRLDGTLKSQPKWYANATHWLIKQYKDQDQKYLRRDPAKYYRWYLNYHVRKKTIKGYGKLFRRDEGIFSGETINTPSMLCVADALDSLLWMKELGGLNATSSKTTKNFNILQDWLDQQDWIENLVINPAYRSNTSVCLKIIAEEFLHLSNDKKTKFLKHFVELLKTEKVAYDIGSHRKAPLGLRIWCGATVESKDLRLLLPWLSWAFESSKAVF